MRNNDFKDIKYYKTAQYSPRRPLTNRHGQQFPNQKLKPEERMVLYQRWQGGETLQALAEEYGISFYRTRNICYEIRRTIGATR